MKDRFYVYILSCGDGKTYVGCTRDLEDRVARHQRGSVPSTKDSRSVELITYLVFSDKYRAFEFEKYLKSRSGRAFLKKRLI